MADQATPTDHSADRSSRRRMISGGVGPLVVLVVVFWFIFTVIGDPQGKSPGTGGSA